MTTNNLLILNALWPTCPQTDSNGTNRLQASVEVSHEYGGSARIQKTVVLRRLGGGFKGSKQDLNLVLK